MTVNDNMTALARAVLAGDGPAVFGLIDEVLAAADGGPSREWLELWDRCAIAYMSGQVAKMSRPLEDNTDVGGTVWSTMARWAYCQADAMMAMRARFLATRTAKKE